MVRLDLYTPRIVGFSLFAACIAVSDDDRRYNGGSSGRLLAALRTTSRHITTPQPASLCCGLAVLHGVADGGAPRSVSVLPWSPTRHLLGCVHACLSF